MNLLITGGTGFIGTHLLDYLVRLDYIKKIIVFDLVERFKFDIVSEKVEVFKVDIREPIQNNFDFKIDVCIHLAALAKEPGYKWEEYFITNLKGTSNLLEFCEASNIKRLIFTSTMMVFKAGEKRYTESDLTCPDTAYGISKLLAEKEIKIWSETNGNSSTIIRPSVVFGYCEGANFTRLVKTIRKGLFFYVGRSNTVKSNIYVKELVNFLDFSMSKKIEGIYNFTFPEAYSIKSICEIIMKIDNRKRWIPVIPYKLLYFAALIFNFMNNIGIRNGIHPRRIQKLYYSTNINPKAVKSVGYKFVYDLESGLRDWFKESNNLKNT